MRLPPYLFFHYISRLLHYMKNHKYYDVPFSLIPIYDKEFTELFFYFPSTSISEIKLKNYFILNHGKPTTNYKSIHFILNGKELNEEEIQNFILSDPNNEIINLYQDKKDLFRMHYYIRVI